jgi:hypothetical protein
MAALAIAETGPASAQGPSAQDSRGAAILDCNVRAGKVGSYRDWQAAQITVYRDCMFEHWQPWE